MSKNYAGTILCFDRYEYTKQLVESLERCVGVEDVDWYVFQDGTTNPLSGIDYAEEEDLDKVKEIFDRTTLNIVKFERSSFNGSIPRQKWKAHKVFDLGYETVFFFEDDLVVSKYYIRLLKIMAKQYPNDVGSLFSLGTGKNLGKARVVGGARLWGYYMNKGLYYKIKEQYDFYYSQIKKVDYNSRWLFEHVRKEMSTPFGRMHDVCLSRLIRHAGGKKRASIVTRATYIGRKGNLAYRTDRTWHKKGMHNQPKTIEHLKDAKLKRFK